MIEETCVGCGREFQTETIYHSSLFQAQDNHVLCEACHKREEAAIEENGTNNVPKLLESYQNSFVVRLPGTNLYWNDQNAWVGKDEATVYVKNGPDLSIGQRVYI